MVISNMALKCSNFEICDIFVCNLKPDVCSRLPRGIVLTPGDGSQAIAIAQQKDKVPYRLFLYRCGRHFVFIVNHCAGSMFGNILTVSDLGCISRVGYIGIVSIIMII